MKKILTNYIFKFLFEKDETFRDGDIIECQGDIFIFDDENGNSNRLKYFINIDGFWNWLKVKKGSQYNIDKKRFIKENEEEYNTEYYKNSYRKATEKEKQNYVVAFCNKY